jgi:hypothetical protein
MRIDPDTCRDLDLLAAEVRRLQAAIEELRSAADQADIDYLKEIAQLRLTKAERDAVRWAEHEAQAFWEMGGGSHGFELAATLRSLLERTKE